MRSRICAAAALLIACHRDAPPPPPQVDPASITWSPIVDAGPKPQYRADPPVNPVEKALAGKGKTFLVASESEIASKVGRDVMAAGGNAVDGAVAVAFALAVVHPTA